MEEEYHKKAAEFDQRRDEYREKQQPGEGGGSMDWQQEMEIEQNMRLVADVLIQLQRQLGYIRKQINKQTNEQTNKHLATNELTRTCSNQQKQTPSEQHTNKQTPSEQQTNKLTNNKFTKQTKNYQAQISPSLQSHGWQDGLAAGNEEGGGRSRTAADLRGRRGRDG